MHGRSKLPFILAIKFGVKRFKEISKEIGGITDNMLYKELKVLEMNQLVKRTIHNTFPPTVEYSITEHGLTLEKVINELGIWGSEHRRKIIGK